MRPKWDNIKRIWSRKDNQLGENLLDFKIWWELLKGLTISNFWQGFVRQK